MIQGAAVQRRGSRGEHKGGEGAGNCRRHSRGKVQRVAAEEDSHGDTADSQSRLGWRWGDQTGDGGEHHGRGLAAMGKRGGRRGRWLEVAMGAAVRELRASCRREPGRLALRAGASVSTR
jgi:hypothetical protein